MPADHAHRREPRRPARRHRRRVVEERPPGGVGRGSGKDFRRKPFRLEPHAMIVAALAKLVDVHHRRIIGIVPVPGAELPGRAHRLGGVPAVSASPAASVDDMADCAHRVFAAVPRRAPHGEGHPVGVDDVDLLGRDDLGGGRRRRLGLGGWAVDMRLKRPGPFAPARAFLLDRSGGHGRSVALRPGGRDRNNDCGDTRPRSPFHNEYNTLTRGPWLGFESARPRFPQSRYRAAIRPFRVNRRLWRPTGGRRE